MLPYLALLNSVKHVELHLKWQILDVVVMYRMSLCSAGASRLAADNPLLLHRWEAELRGDMQCTALEVYLCPLQKGKMMNHTYLVADLKCRDLSFPLS